MNDNSRGASHRLMCLQTSKSWWIYLYANLRGQRRGVWHSHSLISYIDILFKRNGCLPGVPIEERYVLIRSSHSSLLKLFRRPGDSRRTERNRPPGRNPGGGATRCSKHGHPTGRAVSGPLCGSQGCPATAEELRGR